MKLKNITLGVFIVFVASIAGIALYSEYKPQSSTNVADNPLDTVSTVSTVGTVPVSNTGAGSVTLTLAEIARHNTRNDCYLIMKDSVYSVAGFIDQHPGGVKKITDMCGKEATKIFTAIHSNFAWNLLKDFYIGKVGESINIQSANTTVQSNIQSSTNMKSLKSNGGDDDGDDDQEGEGYED